MKKFVIGLLLTVVTILPTSILVMWDQNTEPDIGQYRVYRAVNGGGFLPTSVAYPAHQLVYNDIFSSSNYQFYVTAVNTNQLESGPSAFVAYSLPNLPPMLNVQKVIVGGASGTNWTAVQVFFDTIDLSAYQATNYWVYALATNGGRIDALAAVSSPAVFTTLPIQSCSFSVRAYNAAGGSPTGATVFLSGQKPSSPTNIKIQTGP